MGFSYLFLEIIVSLFVPLLYINSCFPHPSPDFHESCIVHTAMQKCHFPCEHIRRLEQNIKLAGVHAYNFYLLLKGGLST